MKLNNTSIIAASLVASGLALATGCATDKTQKELEAQAKLSKQQAQTIALAKAPGGTVTESELEKEKGKLVWSFDIATPGSKDITEVLVDAVTGNVVSVEKETPEDQVKEKAKDKEK
jgi:uncharacterized membrane protein YkoI